MATSTALKRAAHEDVERVVLIAASAGGIQALITVLCALPANFSAPVLILQHRTTGRPGMLARVLQRGCHLPVKDAHPGDRLESGTVYVTPANRHTRITQDHVMMMSDHIKINFLHASADPLFRSAAEAFGARAIGVVLSGGGKNGAAGSKAIRDAGGIVIAQNEATSEHFGMPKAAIDAGAVTDVLALDDIAGALTELVDHSHTR
jgi:two-component system chemotaxis response regulator CheB